MTLLIIDVKIVLINALYVLQLIIANNAVIQYFINLMIKISAKGDVLMVNSWTLTHQNMLYGYKIDLIK